MGWTSKVHPTFDSAPHATPEHPLYSEGKWIAAEDLQLGDQIQTSGGTSGTVEKIETENRLQAMYNLTVATTHTYFVGEGAWLVHNACPNPVKPYEVGSVDDLYGRSLPGDNLDIHHAPQQKPAGQVIPGYNPDTAPGIALPHNPHMSMNATNLTGRYAGTPRQLLAKTIWDLRNIKVPNEVLWKLINLNKTTYPGVYR